MTASGKACKAVELPVTKHLIFKCPPIDEKIICLKRERCKID